MKKPESPKIRFNFVSMKWENLYASQITAWQNKYPEIDVFYEITTQMIVKWLDKAVITRNPLRVRKDAQKKNWRRTIINWLLKERQKAVGIR